VKGIFSINVITFIIGAATGAVATAATAAVLGIYVLVYITP